MNLFQHFTVLLVVLCALTLLTTEAARKGRRNRKNGRKGKRRGRNNNDKRPQVNDERQQVNDERPQVEIITVCPLNPTCDDCGKTTGDANSNRANRGKVKFTSKDAADDELKATLDDFNLLKISLKELVDAKSFKGKDDVYPGYGTKELNPTDKTKLSSDKKFRLLGQMTWWLTWIEASLRILQEIMLRVKDKKLNPNNIVPVATDTDNGNVFTINSTLKALLTVKRSVNHLHSMLGHEINTTANNSPFSCRNVTVMQACRKKEPDCSKEVNRAYIVLRDAHKAVEKMGEALSGCKGKKKGSEIVLKCTRNVIFYQKKCQKTLCGLQKKRCKCLSWTYE